MLEYSIGKLLFFVLRKCFVHLDLLITSLIILIGGGLVRDTDGVGERGMLGTPMPNWILAPTPAPTHIPIAFLLISIAGIYNW